MGGASGKGLKEGPVPAGPVFTLVSHSSSVPPGRVGAHMGVHVGAHVGQHLVTVCDRAHPALNKRAEHPGPSGCLRKETEPSLFKSHGSWVFIIIRCRSLLKEWQKIEECAQIILRGMNLSPTRCDSPGNSHNLLLWDVRGHSASLSGPPVSHPLVL